MWRNYTPRIAKTIQIESEYCCEPNFGRVLSLPPPSTDMPVVVSANIQHSTTCEASGAEGNHAGLRWANRRPAVLALLRDIAQTSDVVMLQEIRAYNIADVVEAVQSSMAGPSFYYECPYGTRVNAEDGSRDNLVVVVCADPGDFVRVEFEYGSAMVLGAFNHKTGELFCTTHFPLGEQARLEMATLVGAKLGAHPATKVFLGGDFNAFPDASGHWQMQTLMGLGRLMDSTQFLRQRSNGRRATVTFRPYPYDKAPAIPEPDKLDYMLTRGVVPTSAVCVDDMGTCYQHDGVGYGPTDHYPLIVRARYL